MAQENKIEISASANYVNEDFRWSIAGNIHGKNPNIYSELIWKNLNGSALQLHAKYNILERVVLEAQYSKFSILRGRATDADYQEDNRINPVFNATLKSNQGNTSAFLAGFGYRIFQNNKYQVITGLGYGENRQFLFLLDNKEVEEGEQQLNTTYKTSWRGVFISLEPQINITEKTKLTNRFNYHQVKYTGTADWNLIEEFQHPVSFEHTAKGYGIENRLELSLKMTSKISAHISGNYYYWETGAGIDKLYLLNGDIKHTRLNGAERKGGGVGLGFSLSL